MAFRELDTVVLTHDVPDAGLCTDDLGAIVHLHSGDTAEVEIVTAAGRTQALRTRATPTFAPCGMMICSRCVSLRHRISTATFAHAVESSGSSRFPMDARDSKAARGTR